MSKLNHLLTGIVAFGLGVNTANFIHNSNREQRASPAPIVQTHPSTLEDCVVEGVITGSNIPIVNMEKVRMRASGLDPIRVKFSVNNGSYAGNYEVIVDGFTNLENGSPKSRELKMAYQNLFDTFSTDWVTGGAIPFSCGLFDSLRSNSYPVPRIVKVR